MVNLLYKIKYFNKRKKHTLHSIGVGCIFFIFVLVVTCICPSPLCISQNLFGIQCPGCGMSRAFLSILQLDFAGACKYNLLSIPLFFGILVYVVLALVDVVFDKNYVYRIEKQGLQFLLPICLIIIGIKYLCS